MPSQCNCSFCGAQLSTRAAQDQAHSPVIICTSCLDLLTRAEQGGPAVRSPVVKALVQAQRDGKHGSAARAQGEAALQRARRVADP